MRTTDRARLSSTRSRVVSVLCAAGLGVGLVSCSSPAEQTPGPTGPTPAGPAQVGRFASDNPGSVNTFWLSTPQGLVVVDTGRNVTGGRRVVQETQRTGKPVIAILITHSHPDHVGGMGELRQAYPQAPIYASEATINVMRTDPLMLYSMARRDDPDYPAQLTYPDRGFAPGAPLDVGGLRLETAQFGPGESESATAYYEPGTGALFAGDLTDNQATPALIEGNTCEWLTNLDQLRGRFPDARTIYAGHGAPAEAGEQIQAQRTYLQTFRGLIRPAVGAGSAEGPAVSADEQTSILAEVDRRYPDYPPVAALPALALKQANVAAVARELAAENPATLPPICRG